MKKVAHQDQRAKAEDRRNPGQPVGDFRTLTDALAGGVQTPANNLHAPHLAATDGAEQHDQKDREKKTESLRCDPLPGVDVRIDVEQSGETEWRR